MSKPRKEEHAYRVEIFWRPADDGFIAVAPDLLGCSAFGATRDEAAREIGDAIEGWLSACRGVKNPVPAPSVSPLADPWRTVIK